MTATEAPGVVEVSQALNTSSRRCGRSGGGPAGAPSAVDELMMPNRHRSRSRWALMGENRPCCDWLVGDSVPETTPDTMVTIRESGTSSWPRGASSRCAWFHRLRLGIAAGYFQA